MKTINQWPGVMKTKIAHEYVGGKPVWDDLITHYGAMLQPLRTTPQGWQYWSLEIIDTTLRAAQMDGKLNRSPSGT